MDAQVLQAEAEVTTGAGVAADAAIDGLGPGAADDDGDGGQAPQPGAEEVPGGPHACYEAEFEVRPGFRIGVSSVAGVSTCVWVPPLKAVFDCGLCLGRTTKYSHVFVSHGHMDHCSACPQHTSLRGLQGSSSAATYVVPEAAADPLEAVFANFRLLNDSELPAVVAAAAPGQEFRMANNNTCVAFETFHRVPSVGYAVYSHRKKLKAEYVGLESSEIGALAKQGVAVSESVAVCEFAYTGDTTIEAVEANECVRTARVLVMECTIVDDKLSPEVTHERGHIHLEDIAARADMFENEAIVLMHFSARHHANDIVEAVQATLPPDLASRVWLALSRHKMEAGGAASGFGDE